MIIEVKKVMSFSEYDNKRFEDAMHLINCVIGGLEDNDARGLISLATSEAIPIEDLEKTLYTLSILKEHCCMKVVD